MSFLGLFAILALFAQVLQSGSGVIEGVVTEAGTGLSRTATSDEQGRYVIPSLRPATYALTGENPGFSKFTQPGIALQREGSDDSPCGAFDGNLISGNYVSSFQ